MSGLSIKRVHRLIEEERKDSLIHYFKRFLQTASAKKHKTEIEKYANKIITDENYLMKKDLLKRLEKWNM